MNNSSLNGYYKLKYVDHDTPIFEILSKDFVPEGWLDTDVPEDVRTVLRRYGYISGHYYDKDVDAERWIDKKDWIYYKSFYVNKELSKKKNFIVFDGIDTLAEIYINEAFVGKCENMHISYEFDVTEYLNYGTLNTLVVRVISPIKSIEDINRDGLYPKDDTSRLLLRKSQMNYGWDFCGYCLTTGIWKDVYISSHTHAKLNDVHVYTESLNDDEALLSMEVETTDESYYDIGIEVSFDGDVIHCHKGSVKDMEKYTFKVSDPRLWWPRPYGEPNLYQATIRLYFKNKVIDEKNIEIGVRTIDLEQRKLSDGTHTFTFVINGKRIFVRGANWVPINAVYGEITAQEYEYYISEAVDANLSMLRIWGGGIYESDKFFELCDRNGIMVFQDFMLACGIFPQDDAFISLVAQEAEYIVKKYRNHASLVLWSGDNEVDQSYGWYDKEEYVETNKVNRKAIAEAVMEYDGHRPFIVSSPTSMIKGEMGSEDPNSPLQGDMHIYLPRFHKNSSFYYKKIKEFVPRFMSEYGFSSLPNKDTYEKFNFFQKSLEINRDPHFGKLGTFSKLANEEDYDTLIETTQFSHAQGLKYAIEYMRSFKWECSGILYWKFNDPIAPNRPNMLFPTLMSSIDFYGNRKSAYYYSRRAYEDTIIAFREDSDDNLSIVSCNELEEEFTGDLIVSAWDFHGKKTTLDECNIIIPSNESKTLLDYDKKILNSLKSNCKYLKVFFESDNLEMENIYYLTDIEDFLQLNIPQTSLKASIISIDKSKLNISIESVTFAKDVQIKLITDSNQNIYYSDNLFDMDANSKEEIEICFDVENIRETRIKIQATNSSAMVFNLCDFL